jgi:nucleotide-binding universal stress UspA family protein
MNDKRLKKNESERDCPKVLMAVSDEDYAFAIADFVKDHKWPEDTQFYIFYVVEEAAIRRVLRFSPDIASEIVAEDEVYGARLVQRVEKHLHQSMPKIPIEVCVGRGTAKNEILNKAAEIGAHFIVLGAHGRLGVSSLLLGSVSAAVMMEANCSVLIVRLGAAKQERALQTVG